MPSRIIPFVNNEYYHIYNRGVAKAPIFLLNRNYQQFLHTLLYYQYADIPIRLSLFDPKKYIYSPKNKLVEIVCYCSMPNHFHLVLKQIQEGGITRFMGLISNSYTRYFNTKNQRVGPLFQGEFKAKLVNTNEQLNHLSRYIHLNPLVAYLTKSLTSYRWSSYLEYIGASDTKFFSKEIILDQFPNREDYRRFVLDQIDYQSTLEIISDKTIDIEE